MTRLPIGIRLTLSYFLIFALGQTIFGLGIWVVLRHNLYDLADDALENQIDDVRHSLAAQPADTPLTQLQEEIGKAYRLGHSGEYLQIVDNQGNWIYRGGFLQRNQWPTLSPGQLLNPRYEDQRIGGRSFRFLSQVVEANGGRFVVQTAIPDNDILHTLGLFQRDVPLIAVAMLLLASGVGYWLSRRALAPVDAITRAARDITGANLNRRVQQLQTGDELQRLSDTLNEMLARIEAAFVRVSQFTADASHELRTPVSLIRTEAEIALRKSRDEAEYKDALSHILAEAEKTSALIEQLLSLARADAGREQLDFRRLDLRDALQTAAIEWRRTASANGLEFTEALDGSSLFVAADRSLLQRLLNILLDNAVKYTPAPGSIEIKLQERAGNAVITVRDSGIGMTWEDQSRIFERFYRADKARSHESGGTGLGLSIARWIVEQHGGSIAVDSTLGAGSTFVVQLPVVPTETPAHDLIAQRS